MNILITGGAGYIGAELTYALSALKEVGSIVVYDNLMGKNYALFNAFTFHPKIKFIEGDLLDSRKLKNALKDIDVVYHLAALSDKNPSLDSHLFEQINHWGTSELVNAIEETEVKKLLYVSSTSVYGFGADIFDESSTPSPTTYYATSKWRGEEQVKRLFEKKEVLILRLGNVYGPSPASKYQGVINKFMFDAHFKGRISIYGNGRQYRSYLHISNAVNGLVQLLRAKVKSGCYNITDKNLQVLDIVEVLQVLYPALEFIFINQHLKIDDLQVSPKGALSELLALEEQSLEQELLKFKQTFGF